MCGPVEFSLSFINPIRFCFLFSRSIVTIVYRKIDKLKFVSGYIVRLFRNFIKVKIRIGL